MSALTLQNVYDCASPDERELPLMLKTDGRIVPVFTQSVTITEDENGKHPAQMLVLSDRDPEPK